MDVTEKERIRVLEMAQRKNIPRVMQIEGYEQSGEVVGYMPVIDELFRDGLLDADGKLRDTKARLAHVVNLWITPDGRQYLEAYKGNRFRARVVKWVWGIVGMTIGASIGWGVPRLLDRLFQSPP